MWFHTGEGEGVIGAILQSFWEGEGELFGDVDLHLSSSLRKEMERLMF